MSDENDEWEKEKQRFDNIMNNNFGSLPVTDKLLIISGNIFGFLLVTIFLIVSFITSSRFIILLVVSCFVVMIGYWMGWVG